MNVMETILLGRFRMAVILEIVNGTLSDDLGAAATPVTSQQVRVNLSSSLVDQFKNHL